MSKSKPPRAIRISISFCTAERETVPTTYSTGNTVSDREFSFEYKEPDLIHLEVHLSMEDSKLTKRWDKGLNWVDLGI